MIVYKYICLFGKVLLSRLDTIKLVIYKFNKYIQCLKMRNIYAFAIR